MVHSPPEAGVVGKASWQARLAAFVVRRRVKPQLADMRDIQRVRKVFGQALPAPRGVRFIEAAVGGVRGEWVEADSSSPAFADANANTRPTTLLYLHGGGFVGCSPRTHRPLTGALALQGLRVFVPDYRLAPEHPFPAAPQDVQAVYRALRAGLAVQSPADPSNNAAFSAPSQRLVVAGDSAGGNLALGLMLALKDAGEALPDAAALFSPALDLTGGSPSITLNAQRDAMFNGPQLEHLAAAYLQGADAAQPLASPLLGDLRGLPPLLIHVGQSEALRDDSLRLAQRARESGVTVDLQTFPVVPHVWQMLRLLPEARQSVALAARFLREALPRSEPETLDVLIIGAGLSGIGAAVHLQTECPGKSFALLESRQALGGTWDLFRYPGVRSDSDMYTLGYRFKPWRDAKAIADGPAIRQYIEDTAAEHGITPRIRYGQRVISADWSNADAVWTLQVERVDAASGEAQVQTLRARFLWSCSGYYNYSQPYQAPLPHIDQFKGRLLHPQFWPEQLDYSGQRVLVIGSGATAVTLVPEMAKTAAHVTMLQRSPSYVVEWPSRDHIAEALKRWLPAKLAYWLVRAKNVTLQQHYYRLARKYPEKAKQRLVGLVQQALGPDFDVQRHFTPNYKPWDQRVCLVPDGDLFKTLREGRASMVTDQIENFTEHGVRLKSGKSIEADIIVTATGLQMSLLGDVKLSIDGAPVDLSQRLVYKGMMFSGVPNLANTFGYTNASWTLKADLTADHVCRLLQHMQRQGQKVCTPRPDSSVQPEPFLGFTSGYVQRALPLLPKQGDRKPWRLYQNYLLDLLSLRLGKVEDGVMEFRR